ncbi:hypothetical protein I4U23_028091 [Adineta vaga]|nr:hypothetical protein I4U23_028091 [Adineta vaga]
MSTEIFVDGICEFDDKTLHSYFGRFGSRISHYECHRQRSTNACCFALITFVSHHTVDAILRQRPHAINSYPLFVKRILPSTICSFSERLLSVRSLFVQNRITKELEEEKLIKYFQTFGEILKFEYDSNHQRLLVEFEDYDSVDRIFLNKEDLPKYIEIHKNLLPRAQNQIQYHGTCRPKERETKTDEKQNTYQDLLQKTIEELTKCKAQLKQTKNDYIILQMEYATIKDKYDQLNDSHNTINECYSCKEYQQTISKLQQTSTTSPKQSVNSTQPHQYILSKRLNNDLRHKDQVSESTLSQSHLPLSVGSKQVKSRSCKQQYRLIYKYESVLNDDA